jgi:hypothetical protein
MFLGDNYGATTETREGWPLLTVEAKANQGVYI